MLRFSLLTILLKFKRKAADPKPEVEERTVSVFEYIESGILSCKGEERSLSQQTSITEF